MSRVGVCLLAGVFVLTGGCQKLHVSRTVELDKGETEAIIIKWPQKPANFLVEASATGSKVDIWVVAEKDREKVMASLRNGKRPDSALVLGSALSTDTSSLEGSLGGENEFAIIVGGATKKAEVKVKAIPK